MISQRTTRGALALVASLVLVLAGLWLPAGQASAGPPDDGQRFVQLINGLRTGKGLNPLAVDAELGAQAQAWTTIMAGNDQLAHAPDMTAGISAPWIVLGENVGVHAVGQLDELFQAFVNSPAHYQNLVDPRFHYVGVGVVHDGNGKLWTTHRFMATSPPPQPPPPPTRAPPTTAPPVTTPPTTAAPTSAQPVATTAPPPPATTIIAPVQATTAAPVTSTTDKAPQTVEPAKKVEDGDQDQATAPVAASDPAAEAGDQRVRPDIKTIEDVLIDLVEAGI